MFRLFLWVFVFVGVSLLVGFGMSFVMCVLVYSLVWPVSLQVCISFLSLMCYWFGLLVPASSELCLYAP